MAGKKKKKRGKGRDTEVFYTLYSGPFQLGCFLLLALCLQNIFHVSVYLFDTRSFVTTLAEAAVSLQGALALQGCGGSVPQLLQPLVWPFGATAAGSGFFLSGSK